LVPSPVFATAYHQCLDDQAPTVYGRWEHDTAVNLERALGALDGGLATVFTSGMAAISATMLSLVRAGDTVVLARDATYYETLQIAEQLGALGVHTRLLDDVETELAEAAQGARLVLLESPVNPFMTLRDLRQCAAVAHAAGALLAVDNSVSSPLGQRPLDLGADLVITSDAKVVGGHNDVILGHVSTKDEQLTGQLRRWRHLHGMIAGPFECWLVHRSVGTLELRLDRQSANAQALVELLQDRPEVKDLRWPGWSRDPQAALARAQMIRPGGMFSLRLPDRAHLHRFLRASECIMTATSYGGLQTMANDISTWPALKAEEGFVRISAGCENTRDLSADVVRALDAASSGSEDPR
jgi:cystathionine gamma-lyase